MSFDSSTKMSDTNEKGETWHVESAPSQDGSFEKYVIDPEAERQFLRKIDYRIVPMVWLLYTMSYLDRGNIGNAEAGGMQQSLSITSTQYSVILLVFFISYVIFEVPSNMILTRVRPSIYLSVLCVIWGIVAACMGAAQNFSQIAGIRFCLGIVEAGFSPGVGFYMSSWYKRHELARRYAVYYTATAVSGAFSGLLAGVITNHLHLARGIEGWRWLFIIEGIGSCAVGLFSWIVLPDWPSSTKWLTEDEKILAAQRLLSDDIGATQGETNAPSHWQAMKSAFCDWRTIFLCIMYMLSTGAQTIQYFIPTLVGQLGYTSYSLQFMTIPIYGVAFVCILAFCFTSDIRKERANYITYSALLATVSFIITVTVDDKKVKYAFLCFAVGGVYAACPLTLMWVANIILHPAEKRAVAIAIVNALGNSASIYGSFLWPSYTGPRYVQGFAVTTIFVFLLAVLAQALKVLLRKYPYGKLTAEDAQIFAETNGRKRKRTRKEMNEAEGLDTTSMPRTQRTSDGSIGGYIERRPSNVSERDRTSVQFNNPYQNTSRWNDAIPEYNNNIATQDPGSTTSDTQSLPDNTDLDQLFQSIFSADSSSDARTQVQAANLARNLDSQVAVISGDPAKSDNLELYYYRISGSTAIHPGINRISLKLQARNVSSPIPEIASRSERENDPGKNQPTLDIGQRLFDDNDLVLPHIYIPLLDTFFRTMSQHFPSINRRRMSERLETGTMSSFLLTCICAISARFDSSLGKGSLKACTPFIAKAQLLAVDLLHLPTHDVVTGLLLLAWAHYGQNSESGFWQYSGIAIRMAIDLGLHKNSELYESPAHVVRTRLLFWSLFITDRVLSFVTGRVASIPEDIIEIPLPTDADLFPEPASDMKMDMVPPNVEVVPFPLVVRLMVVCGRISNCLNGRRGKARTFVSRPDTTPELLHELQTQLIQFYTNIPEAMKWSVDAFKYQESRGSGGIFLFLHLWANAVLAQTYQPELSGIRSGEETSVFKDVSRSVKMALTSSRLISECLVFADLLSSLSYCASPGIVQPIYVAGLAYALDMKTSEYTLGSRTTSEGTPTATNAFLKSVARQNLSALMKALQRMEQYWSGVSYVSEVLEQRISGLDLPRINPTASSKNTFIALPDKGILKRFTGKKLPHHTAPATESSLQEAIKENATSASHPGLSLIPSLKVVTNAAHDTKKVATICGGGAGHEPGSTGFVGRGLLSASVSGDVFASPSAKQVYGAIKAVPSAKGTVLIVTNYTGDNLHFGLACQKARADGIENIGMIVVADDVAVEQKPGSMVGRRALSGIILVCKILGAASEFDYSFTQVMNLGHAVNKNLVSIAATLDHCHVPGRDHFAQIPKNTIEIGLGLHNEPDDPYRSFVPFSPSDDVVLFIANMGGMSVLEMGAVVNETLDQLGAKGIKPVRVFNGPFMTSMNAPGISISLLNLTNIAKTSNHTLDELLQLIDAPHGTFSWPGSAVYQQLPDAIINRSREEKFLAMPEMTAKAEMQAPSNLQFEPDVIVDTVKRAALAVLEAEPNLTKWDAIVGDGDCGETCAMGAKAVLDAIDKGLGSDGDVVHLLREITEIIDESMGGTLGAILGIFFAALTQEVRKAAASLTTTPNATFWGNAGAAAIATLQQSTAARVGHRTVMDALVPFVESLQTTNDLQLAIDACRQGGESTAHLAAKLGRATYVSQTENVPDPGAMAVVALTASWRQPHVALVG
ncbi:hypothetical protein BZG36_02667 [Bifiguratus adelaidae]|uniref:Major facilitator superfamily (MFS) profile domain-containing protein n=1 Tax=Bifiguratus adelaidae TaxID=1938954 RepID=A0A261Y1K7_9FUNG|nr:hypothetical protein BZG36_02667 [Bifiguratus adelaidae]